MTLVKKILFVCLLPFLGRGQTFFDNKYHVGYNNLLSSNVITEDDSGFVFLNYVSDSLTGRQDLGLIRLDKNGNVLAQKKFNMFNQGYGTSLPHMNQFIIANFCSYFLSGSLYYANATSAIFSKINRTTLDTIKTSFHHSPGKNYFINNLIKFNNNKYYGIGNKFTTTIQWPVILQLDSNLNVINEIDVANPTGFACMSAIFNPTSKKILLSGPTPVPLGNNQPMTLMHIDTLGVISNTTMIKAPTYLTGVTQAYYSANDNSYVLLCVKQTGKYGNLPLSRICVTKVNATSLKLLWQKTYGDEGIENSALDAVILADGSIVLSGAYSYLTSLPLMNANYGGHILKLNKDGNVQWMRKYDHYGPGNYYEGLVGIDVSKEYGFNLCGSITNLPKAKAWAMKVDSMGCVTSSNCPSYTMEVITVPYDTTEVVDTNSTVGLQKVMDQKPQFKIYPNPTRSILNIEYTEEKRGEVYHVELTDITGRILIRSQLENGGMMMNLSDVQSGVYLLRTYKSGQLFENRKVIKRDD